MTSLTNKPKTSGKWNPEEDVYLWEHRDDPGIQLVTHFGRSTINSITSRLRHLRDPDHAAYKRLHGMKHEDSTIVELHDPIESSNTTDKPKTSSKWKPEEDVYLWEHRDDPKLQYRISFGRSPRMIKRRLRHLRDPDHAAYKRLHGMKHEDSAFVELHDPIESSNTTDKPQTSDQWEPEEDVYLWEHRDDPRIQLVTIFGRSKGKWITSRLRHLCDPDHAAYKRLHRCIAPPQVKSETTLPPVDKEWFVSGTLHSFLGTAPPVSVNKKVRLPPNCTEDEIQTFIAAYKGAQQGTLALGAAGVSLRSFLCDVLKVHGITMTRLWDLASAYRITKQSMFEVYNLAKNPYLLAKESPPLITYDSCQALQRKYGFEAKPADIAGALVVGCLYGVVSGGNSPFVPTYKLEAALMDCGSEYARYMKQAVKTEVITQRWDGKQFVPKRCGGSAVSTTRSLWGKMRYIEQSIKELGEECDDDVVEWSDEYNKHCSGIVFNDLQKQAFMAVYNHSGVAITGGPGTGKTTTIAAINRAMVSQGTTVFNLAFSGKAVKVLRDRLPERSHCYTLHRFLRIIVHECDKLDFDGSIIICDEASMVDINLLDELVKHANRTQSRLVLVGDPNQLPPVGLGSPFNDLIHSVSSGNIAFPHVALITTNRYAEEMATFVGNIEKGIWTPPHNVKFYELPQLPHSKEPDVRTWGDTEDDMKRIIRDLMVNNPDLRDLSKTMYLSPQHNYACGTKIVNEWLQSIINPDGDVLHDRSFWGRGNDTPLKDGDVVVRTVNTYGDEDHYNGDDGIITAPSQSRKYNIAYTDGGKEELRAQRVRDDFELGYVRTIHKSQGGEIDNVVILGPSSCHGMWRRAGSRRLLTVAVSRAKKDVYILGHKASIQTCLSAPDEVRIGGMFM